MSEEVLRRGLGLRSVVSTSTGLAFAALEYLAAAGLVAYVAGDSAWIAVGTAGLLALLAWGFFGELNGMFPTAAAIRLYMQRAMDDRAALTITFTYMTTIVLVSAADAFIVGRKFVGDDVDVPERQRFDKRLHERDVRYGLERFSWFRGRNFCKILPRKRGCAVGDKTFHSDPP